MKIQFRVNKNDAKLIYKTYRKKIDWKQLSHAFTSAYNWICPNRSSKTITLYVKVRDCPEEYAGWFNYSNTLYVSASLNNCLEEFIRTVFHEFCHWRQYWVEKRSANSIVGKRGNNKWDSDNAEYEAEQWEILGEKIFEMYNILSYIKKDYKKIKKK